MQAKEPKDERLVYEPPRAMRLGDTHAGVGECRPTGSGDAYCSEPGSSATGICGVPGNSAALLCESPGNSATGAGCASPGSGPGNVIIVCAFAGSDDNLG